VYLLPCVIAPSLNVAIADVPLDAPVDLVLVARTTSCSVARASAVRPIAAPNS